MYRENFETMDTLVADLKKEFKTAWDVRSEKSLNRLAEVGKLPTPKKLELLLDPNTPFLEIGPLAAKGMYDGKIHKAGAFVGIGVVAGKEVLTLEGVESAERAQLAEAFAAAALARGHEGVMVKDAAAPYTAGRRGSASSSPLGIERK